MKSSWFDLRQQQLNEHIAKDLKMLDEYRDLLRTEDDPRHRERYKMAIEQLRESAAGYQREYDDLTAILPAQPDTSLIASSNELQHINSKLDALVVGIKAVLEGQDELRCELLAKYDAGQQGIIAAITERLDQSQLETVSAVLGAIESNRLSEAEMRQLVEGTQQSLALLQHANKALPGQAEIGQAFAEQATLKDKLKLAIPLIPLILKYEVELEFDKGASLGDVWRQLKARFRR